MIISMALALQAGSVGSSHAAAIEQAILDLCPRVLAGSLSVTDAAQLRRVGYRPVAAGRPGEPRAMRGRGDRRIYLIFRPRLEQWRCAVIWGGRDSDAMLEVIGARARRRGYSTDGPYRLVGRLRTLRLEGDPPLQNLFATLHSTPDKDFIFAGIDLVPHAGAVVDLEED